MIIFWSILSTGWFLQSPVLDHLFSAPRVEAIGVPDNGEFVFWDHKKTYFQHCRKDLLRNEVWGKSMAPFVDKVTAKEIVGTWSPSVEIVPTYAFVDQSNVTAITGHFLKSLPQPYVFKGTHAAGFVFQVQADICKCIKPFKGKCRKDLSIDGRNSISKIQKFSMRDLKRNHTKERGEPQYASLTPKIIFEKSLNMSEFQDVAHWYVAGGVPVFASLEHDKIQDVHFRRYYTNDYQPLPTLKLMSPAYEGDPIRKPKSWDMMLRIASDIAKKLPDQVVRVDLYFSDHRVVFSELTMSTSACQYNFNPMVADAILFALKHKQLDATRVSPKFVEQTINGQAWVQVNMDPATRRPTAGRGHPSPVDCCMDWTKVLRFDPDKARPPGRSYGELLPGAVDGQCMTAARSIEQRRDSAATMDVIPLRCLVSNNGSFQNGIAVPKAVSWAKVFWDHVAIDRVFVLVCLICVLWMFPGADSRIRKPNRVVKVFFCLAGVACFMYIGGSDHDGFASGHSLRKTVDDSFFVFQAVHPMVSTGTILCHFATYWFPVVGWFSKDLKTTLVCMVLYETVTIAVGEFMHHREEDNSIHCVRAVFVDTMSAFVLDDLIRIYVLPPFFVYGYLLPKFLWHIVF
eukprot:scaffold1525_cov142-Cylindrotheca_fusiformis.AAC.24